MTRNNGKTRFGVQVIVLTRQRHAVRGQERDHFFKRGRPHFDAIVPSGVLANSPPPYTAPIAVYVAQRTQMSAAVHRPNRAQMGPSGEIARMAHLTQPMPIDRVRGRSRTRISPQPGCTSPTGRSTEIHGVSEAQNGVFGGFRGSKNST